MRGLLRNNLYGVIENIKIVFAFINRHGDSASVLR